MLAPPLLACLLRPLTRAVPALGMHQHPRGVIEVPELSLPIKDSTEPPEPRPFKQLLTRKHANKDTGVWMDWNPKKGSV